MATRKNPSGKYLEMNEVEYERYLAAHRRKVERQIAKETAKAAAFNSRFGDECWCHLPSNHGFGPDVNHVGPRFGQ